MRKHNAVLLGALMLSLGAISAPANSVEMIYGGFSKHIGVHEYDYEGETHKLNEVNPAIGIETEDGYGIAVMKNSYYKTSVLISKGWTTPIESWGDKWALGARIGAVTGYKDTPIGWAVLPFAQGELQYKVTDRWTMVLGYIPPVQDDYVGVFTLHGKIRF